MGILSVSSDQPSKTNLRARFVSGLVVLALLGLLLAPASTAMAGDRRDELSRRYDQTEAGHPVKIVYYALYPVGFVLNALILRPAWWLGQRQPFRSVFGVDAIDSNLEPMHH
jgi:hypothetical protein